MNAAFEKAIRSVAGHVRSAFGDDSAFFVAGLAMYLVKAAPGRGRDAGRYRLLARRISQVRSNYGKMRLRRRRPKRGAPHRNVRLAGETGSDRGTVETTRMTRNGVRQESWQRI